MKVQGSAPSKILDAVSIAKESKLAQTEQINGATLTDGNFYSIVPGTFKISRARAGNEPQAGPPFVRFDTVIESPGQTQHVTVEFFLTSLVAVMYPVISPEEDDDNETAEALEVEVE